MKVYKVLGVYEGLHRIRRFMKVYKVLGVL